MEGGAGLQVRRGRCVLGRAGLRVPVLLPGLYLARYTTKRLHHLPAQFGSARMFLLSSRPRFVKRSSVCNYPGG